MKMEHTVEILRGWPYDGARERMEPIKAGVSLKNGDVVAKQADGTVDKVGATASAYVGLVISGNGDSASMSNTGKALVLWGNYIARVGSAAYAAGAWAPGVGVTAKGGVYALAAAGDPVVGFVLEVTANDANNSASIVINVD